MLLFRRSVFPQSIRSIACALARTVLPAAVLSATAVRADDALLESFQRDLQPVLETYCFDCHGYGTAKGGITLDEFETGDALRDHDLWMRALRNVRTGIMPPADEGPLPAEDAAKIMDWIKRRAFALDPAKPDPGRITVRRLNRVEYRNTIRDLVGVDFDTEKEFPADDTGHGFDNLGDVLTISPMLLEKYLDAAQAIVAQAVPTRSKVVAEALVPGRTFATIKDNTLVAVAEPAAANDGDRAAANEGGPAAPASELSRPLPKVEGEALDLSYYTPVVVSAKHRAAHAGRYEVIASIRAIERYVDNEFDYNRCRIAFRVDGETLIEHEFTRLGDKTIEFPFEREWAAGEHEISFEVTPLTPDMEQKRSLRARLNFVKVRGPLTEEHWVRPEGYAKFFPRDVPEDAAGRRAYAAEILGDFARRAFRRPADAPTVDRLVGLAERVAGQEDGTFEAGVAQAMVAVLASPRFLFREEESAPLLPGQEHPFVDEYALASRLSYFLWSSMPDEELFRLAGENKLRENLTAQVERMLDDPRSAEFVRNFTGQWLQARDIETVAINPLDVYLRENPNPEYEEARALFRSLQPIPFDQRTEEQRAAFRKAREAFRTVLRAPKPQLNDSLRRAMRAETEMMFDYVLREGRNATELIDSDYTFLNEELAKHYDIPGVEGREMRRVTLPPDSPRGGVLTMGTVLAVTSNPTRTSPVKRGVFILDAILGTPPPPPPPNIPSLEDVASPEELQKMSLRETLELHATNGMCASCHSRMDPLGLALENFNALGKWRERDMGQPVEPEGTLITGEAFSNVRELKRILATGHREDFYHNLSEKLLTYALGRGVDYYDVDTLDALVHELEESGGRISALLHAIVKSAPFQQRRRQDTIQVTHVSAPAKIVANE